VIDKKRLAASRHGFAANLVFYLLNPLRGYFLSAAFRAAAGYFTFASPKESIQRKGDPTAQAFP